MSLADLTSQAQAQANSAQAAQDAAQKAAAAKSLSMAPAGSINMGQATGNADYNGINLPGYQSSYVSLYDPNGKLAQEANQVGPSDWAKLSDQQQNASTQDTKQADMVQAQAQAAQGADSLAQQGGLTSGARERNVEGGEKNYLSMAQGADKQNSLNQLQIGVNDQTNRMGEIQSDNQNQILDKQAQATDLQSKSQYNQWLAGQQNSAVAATQQAKAQSDSGGGSFICTELRRQHLISGRQYRALHAIGVTQIFKRLAFTKWYLAHAWKAVELAQVRQSDITGYAEKVRLLLRETDGEQIAMAYMQIAGQFCAEHGQKMPMKVMTVAFYPKFWSELRALPAVVSHPLVWKYIAIGLKEKVKGVFGAGAVRATR